MDSAYFNIRSSSFEGLRYTIRKCDSYVNITSLRQYFTQHYTRNPNNIIGNWKTNKRTKELINDLKDKNIKIPLEVLYDATPSRTFAHPILALDFASLLNQKMHEELKDIIQFLRKKDYKRETPDDSESTKGVDMATQVDSIIEGPLSPEIITAEVLHMHGIKETITADVGTQTDAVDYSSVCKVPFLPPMCTPMNPRNPYIVVPADLFFTWMRDYNNMKHMTRSEQGTSLPSPPEIPTLEPVVKKRKLCSLDMIKEEKDRLYGITNEIMNYYENDFAGSDELKKKLTELQIVHLLQFARNLESEK